MATKISKPRKSKSQGEVSLKYGFRSGLEEAVGRELTLKGVSFTFEELIIPYQTPPKNHRYTPDFVLPNGIIVETKGRFLTADRQKHLLVKQQHPEYDIRFVFSNSKTKISKRSKTTYADWCIKSGFTFADKSIPDKWIKERGNGIPS